MDDDRSPIIGALIVAAYVLAVSAQVFVLVNEATHGQLAADVSARWARLRARWENRRSIDREVADGAPWVLWEAVQATQEGPT